MLGRGLIVIIGRGAGGTINFLSTLGVPSKLRLLTSTATALTWTWDAPHFLGHGATSVQYTTAVREVNRDGSPVQGFTGQWIRQRTGAGLTRRTGTAEGEYWQIRVRAVNNASPPVTSDWVTSAPALAHSARGRRMSWNGRPMTWAGRHVYEG